MRLYENVCPETLLKRSFHSLRARANFVQIQKVEIFQLSLAEWNSLPFDVITYLFDVITYLFAGARSKMANGNHALFRTLLGL